MLRKFSSIPNFLRIFEMKGCQICQIILPDVILVKSYYFLENTEKENALKNGPGNIIHVAIKKQKRKGIAWVIIEQSTQTLRIH